MSMDVVALYPSITGEHAGRRIREAIEKTDVSFDADYRQALRYLARNANDQQLDAWGFGKYVPKRTKNKGTRPGMADTKKIDEKWTEPKIPDDDEIKKKIIAKCMEILTLKLYKSNVYNFNGEIRVQKKGSPIGACFAHEASRVTCGELDAEHLKLKEENRVKTEAEKRYVDDNNPVYRSIDKGYRWNKETKRLEYKDEWKEEDIANAMPDDLRTCNLLLQMMNSLHPDIQFTGDVPSKYPNNRVPMLDLQVGVIYIKETLNEDESTMSMEETPELVPEDELSENEIAYEQIKWEFFKKSMAAKQMLRADSAMPDKIKRTNTVQELIRRVLNITPNLPSTKKDITNVT